MTVGHLKAGVTPAQAIADLNSIGADLEKNYPRGAFKPMGYGSATGLLLGILATPVVAFIVDQATPRDPAGIGWCCSSNGAAGATGDVDYSAACAVG